MAAARRPRNPSDRSPADPAGPGRLRVTPPTVLLWWALGGLVLGWLLRPVTERADRAVPLISWLQVLGLALAAAVLGYLAWLTWRELQVRRTWVDPQRAVNRMVLGKACALVGALLAGGYLGHAISWVGVPVETADERLIRALVASACAVLVLVAALLLERACRIRGDEPTA